MQFTVPAEGNQQGRVSETMANIQRNAPCPCGSGEKYKRCCGAVRPAQHTQISIDPRIVAAQELIGEPDKASREQAIEMLRALIPKLGIDSHDRLNASAALAKAYQSLGQHQEALGELEALSEYPLRELDRALSLSSLGHHQLACAAIDTFTASDTFRSFNRQVYAYLCLDIGKIFHGAGRMDRATYFYEQAREHLDESTEARLHYARATSNLGLWGIYLTQVTPRCSMACCGGLSKESG